MRKGLSKKKVTAIRKIYISTKRTMVDIGNEFGVTATSVMRYCKGIDADNKNRGTGKKAEYCNLTKLTRYQAKKILFTYLKGGITQKTLAKQYGLDQSTISNLCTGKSWKHLFQKEPYRTEILKLKPFYFEIKKLKTF